MCAGCVTSLESVVYLGAGTLAALAHVGRRLAPGAPSPAARRRGSDERTAAFLRQLGLDPAEYLAGDDPGRGPESARVAVPAVPAP